MGEDNRIVHLRSMGKKVFNTFNDLLRTFQKVTFNLILTVYLVLHSHCDCPLYLYSRPNAETRDNKTPIYNGTPHPRSPGLQPWHT